ncbi:hypothetical protein [Nostoc sp. FACHB-280]|uniref:hypothetical protein n=1 Tax=Nostoc sp. FACHB-280 TaxID=2692839 RepID=UPI00198A6AAE|nr:hypothetical protein [Nostoc sp. FACHB-280]MBD2493108.1 hypothetical protein [Nostoc sp. FACHB-280]
MAQSIKFVEFILDTHHAAPKTLPSAEQLTIGLFFSTLLFNLENELQRISAHHNSECAF